MIAVKEYIQNDIKYTDITLTRGDDAELVLPVIQINADGTETAYTPDASDSFAVQVRKGPVVDNTPPAIVINGTVSVDQTDHCPHWSISSADSTVDVASYFWDAEITTAAGKKYTFYTGRFIIIPEETLPASP